MIRRMIGAALAIVLVAAPAIPHKLVARGKPVVVANSSLGVVPGVDWNRIKRRPGRHAESWTLDGQSLNDLTFYAGILPGQALFREVDRRNRPLPRFAASMLAPDIIHLFESSHRLAGGSALFNVHDATPATFAGRPGFRFAYSLVEEGDGLKRIGEATGAVIDGRLYLVTFQAPAIHYFAKNLNDYRAVVASATVSAAPP
jgi:hypothetical protein